MYVSLHDVQQRCNKLPMSEPYYHRSDAWCHNIHYLGGNPWMLIWAGTAGSSQGGMSKKWWQIGSPFHTKNTLATKQLIFVWNNCAKQVWVFASRFTVTDWLTEYSMALLCVYLRAINLSILLLYPAGLLLTSYIHVVQDRKLESFWHFSNLLRRWWRPRQSMGIYEQLWTLSQL